MKRDGSRNQYFIQRIPADVKHKAVGKRLAIPLADGFAHVTISPRAQAVRLSLRTADPLEIKTRNAAAAAYLEGIWAAMRIDVPETLTHKQVTALAGELYRIWEDSERSCTTSMMVGTSGDWVQEDESQEELEAHWEAVVDMWAARVLEGDLEAELGPLIDRLLLTKGIGGVDAGTRGLLLSAFGRALLDAFESRKRNGEGDYSPNPKASKFPEWQAPSKAEAVPAVAGGSLTKLVEDWWLEAKAAGLKPSTYESYSNTMRKLVSHLKHDDAGKVTPEDIVSFKNARIASGVSARTVKDSDLAGLKTAFSWAVMNKRMSINPAFGLTIKIPKPRKLRGKGFTDAEARLILSHAKAYVPGREAPKLAAAKRWVPLLCAFTGARVGEMLQLRKQDIRREGDNWIARITPEAGPVKTDEARDVVLHRQILAAGFMDFISKSSDGPVFISPKSTEAGVRTAVKTARNKVNEFVRGVVPDPNVDPSHGWRHRFKSIGMDEGVEMRFLDAIQGHAPRNNSEIYGEVSIKAIAGAIARFPDINH